MSNQSSNVIMGDEIVGQVSAYTALPTVLCPSCGAKLHRLFNTQTKWQFVCLDEKTLVAPGTEDPPVKVTVK